MKKLYRLEKGKKISGVCSGMADYFDIDINVVRILWALSILLAGCGLLAYLILAICLPEKTEDQ